MISVVIPLYNKEASIKQSLMSVLSQSYQNFEVVIVDDGSTDNSVAKVEEIQDSRIRMIRQENGGPGKARNTGVKDANGEWVLFLDADDELLPDALKIFNQLYSENEKANVIDCVQTVQHGKNTWNEPHDLVGYSKNPYKDWYFHKIGPGSNHSDRKSTRLNYSHP